LEFSSDLPFHLIPVGWDCIDFIVLFVMGIVRRFYSFVKAFLGKLNELPGKWRYLRGLKSEYFMAKRV